MKNPNLHIFIIPPKLPDVDREILEKYLGNIMSDDDKAGLCVADSEAGEIVLSNLDSYRTKMLILFIRNLGIPVIDYDATNMVISGKFDYNVDKVFQDSDSNASLINNFIVDNLSVDGVLDKISEFGMGSLTKEEMNFLNSQK